MLSFCYEKKYPTYIQEDIILQDEIIVSGGKIGMQIKLKVEDFLKVSEAQVVDVISK